MVKYLTRDVLSLTIYCPGAALANKVGSPACVTSPWYQLSCAKEAGGAGKKTCKLPSTEQQSRDPYVTYTLVECLDWTTLVLYCTIITTVLYTILYYKSKHHPRGAQNLDVRAADLS